MFERAIFADVSSCSLYLHIPFCSVRCHYCDFYSKAGFSEVTDFVALLQKEITYAQKEIPHIAQLPIETIFVGGGTPSALSVKQWEQVAQTLRDSFNLSQLKEWTVECNPETFTAPKATSWLQSGVTRISFGVQSLNDSELQAIGRIHKSSRVFEVLQNPVLSSFDSVNCDLIYGLPESSPKSVYQTLQQLLVFENVKHISAYELTIAEGTPISLNPDRYALPTEEELEEQVLCVRDSLRKAGYERYEVSNFAKPGHRCIHNERYWDLSPYLGLGPSAHSFDGACRFSNPASLNDYGEGLQKGTLPWQLEETENSIEEYLFLRLRTSNGLDTSDFKKRFQKNFEDSVSKSGLEYLLEENYLERDGNIIKLPEDKLDIADGVALQLLND